MTDEDYSIDYRLINAPVPEDNQSDIEEGNETEAVMTNENLVSDQQLVNESLPDGGSLDIPDSDEAAYHTSLELGKWLSTVLTFIRQRIRRIDLSNPIAQIWMWMLVMVIILLVSSQLTSQSAFPTEPLSADNTNSSLIFAQFKLTDLGTNAVILSGVIVALGGLLVVYSLWGYSRIIGHEIKEMLVESPPQINNATVIPLFFVVIGIATLLLVKDVRSATFLFMLAWWITAFSGYDLYLKNGNNPLYRYLYQGLLVTVYVVVWYGFMTLAYNNSWYGMLAIYSMGILLLNIGNRAQHAGLQRRAHEDMFILVALLLSFTMIENSLSLFSGANSAGSIINEVFESFVGLSFFPDALKEILEGSPALQNITMLEVYAYAAMLLLWTLNKAETSIALAPTDESIHAEEVPDMVFLVFFFLISSAAIAYSLVSMIAASSNLSSLAGVLVNGIPLILSIPGLIMTLHHLKTKTERLSDKSEA